jgi:hypothetical protein
MMNLNNLKGNWPMMIGAIGMFIYFGVGHFVVLPDALRGFLLGISITGAALGALVAKVGFSRLRGWKKGLLHRSK